MTFLLGLFIALGLVSFIVYPFFKREELSRGELSKRSIALAELNAQKETIYAAMKDLEFEYKMGKLSTEDFTSLYEKSSFEAVSILQKIDQISGKVKSTSKGQAEAVSADIAYNDQIELDIQRYRKQKQPISKRTASPEGVKLCPRCGKENLPEYKFCSSCGEKLFL